jgi:ankyrin repeat protein
MFMLSVLHRDAHNRSACRAGTVQECVIFSKARNCNAAVRGATQQAAQPEEDSKMPSISPTLRSLALALVLALGTPLVQAATEDLSVNARLLLFARNGDLAGVERSLQEGAAANARNRIGETALVIALKKNDLAIAQTMLRAGTDVNLAALNGVTPLMAAAFGGQIDIARELLARGADVGAVDRLRKSAMVYAAGEGHTEIVKLLLTHGVDADTIYANDLTALMWAAGQGKAEAVRALLDAGARTDLKDNRGKTAADIAHELKHEDVARLIETAGPSRRAAVGR